MQEWQVAELGVDFFLGPSREPSMCFSLQNVVIGWSIHIVVIKVMVDWMQISLKSMKNSDDNAVNRGFKFNSVNCVPLWTICNSNSFKSLRFLLVVLNQGFMSVIDILFWELRPKKFSGVELHALVFECLAAQVPSSLQGKKTARTDEDWTSPFLCS